MNTVATVAAEGEDPETGEDGTPLWEALPNPEVLREAKEKIVELQREVSRKERGSSRWERLKGRLARLHQEVARKRTSRSIDRCNTLGESRFVIQTEREVRSLHLRNPAPLNGSV